MKLNEKFQTLMVAAAFAEENEHGTAREFVAEVRAAQPKVRESRPTVTGTLAVNHSK